MNSRPATRTQLVLAFATIYLVWGSTYLAIRVAVRDIPPLVLAGSRFIIGSAAILGFLRARGRPPKDLWNRDTMLVGLR